MCRATSEPTRVVACRLQERYLPSLSTTSVSLPNSMLLHARITELRFGDFWIGDAPEKTFGSVIPQRRPHAWRLDIISRSLDAGSVITPKSNQARFI